MSSIHQDQPNHERYQRERRTRAGLCQHGGIAAVRVTITVTLSYRCLTAASIKATSTCVDTTQGTTGPYKTQQRVCKYII